MSPIFSDSCVKCKNHQHSGSFSYTLHPFLVTDSQRSLIVIPKLSFNGLDGSTGRIYGVSIKTLSY